jgi:hypothetical protein
VIEPPDEAADALLRGALSVGESVELVDQTLGVHPAEAMQADVELSGVIADDRCLGQETMRFDAAPQSPFGGDADRVGGNLERGNAEALEMRLPDQAISKVALGMAGEQGDDPRGEMTPAHIVQRFGVDHVVLVAGAQQLEEVQPALRGGGAEPSKMRVTDLGAKAIDGPLFGARGRLVARPGVVDRDPGGARQRGAQHLARLAKEAVLPGDQQPHHLALGDREAEAAQLLDQPRHRHPDLRRGRLCP